MAVTQVGSTFQTGGGGTNVAKTLTKPTGVALNDLLLSIWGLNGATPTWTLPAGFVTNYQNVSLGEPLALHDKIAGASEPASYNFTTSTNCDGGWSLIALRGADTTTPILGHSADWDAGANTTAFSVNSVSWAGAADAVSLIVVTWQATSATVTWPAGWTQIVDPTVANDGFEFLAAAVNFTTQSGVTSLPAQSLTLSVGQFGTTNQYALKVASGGGGAVALTGTGAAAASAAATLSEATALSGTGPALASATATLALATALSGAGSAQGGSSGILSLSVALSANAAAAGGGSAGPVEATALSGAGVASASASATLAEAVALHAEGDAFAGGSGALGTGQNPTLAGAGGVASGGSATLSVAMALSGQGAAATAGTALLALLVVLVGSGGAQAGGKVVTVIPGGTVGAHDRLLSSLGAHDRLSRTVGAHDWAIPRVGAHDRILATTGAHDRLGPSVGAHDREP